MNKILIIVVVLLLVGVGAYYFVFNRSNNPSTSVQTTTSTATVAKNTVEIKNFSFSPNSITVKVGDSITWTNQDSMGHSATADDGSFDTGIFAQGKSGTVTFNKAGTFTYHCQVHPNMKGTVIVQ